MVGLNFIIMGSLFRIQSLALGIDAACGRMATVRKGRHGWLVESVKDSLVSPGAATLCASALPTRDVLVRPLDLPLKKAKDIAAALEFQVEPLLPFPLEEAVVQTTLVETTEEGTRLNVIAAKKTLIGAHLDTLTFKPERLTAIPLALAALTEMLPPSESPQLLIHFGPAEGTCVLVYQGTLLASHGFDLSEMGLRRALLALGSHARSKDVEEVTFLGDPPFEKALIEEIVEKPASAAGGDLQAYGLAIGTAIAAARDDAPNFRQQEHAYSRPWLRYRKPLLAYAFLICALTGALFFFERSVIARKHQTLDQELASLQAFEQTSGDLEAVRASIQARPDTYPLAPQIPRVSDLLAWFSTHPDLQDIEITEIHYAMTSRPQMSRPKAPYGVEVSLRFTAPSPTLARIAQDALTAANPFADKQKEIACRSSGGVYTCRFTLKDKTRYR